MCGRYAITVTWEKLQQLLAGTHQGEVPVPVPLPSFNVAPTQAVPVLSDTGMSFMRWGIPAPWEIKKGKEPGKARPLVNAQAEKLEKWPWMFHFKERRAVVPATDWYEWITVDGDKRPVRHSAPDGGLLYLAAIWQQNKVLGPCVAVLTVQANHRAARVHHRMPALLTRDEATAWIEAPNAQLARTVEDDRFVQTAANTAVNSYRNNAPAVLEGDWELPWD